VTEVREALRHCHAGESGDGHDHHPEEEADAVASADRTMAEGAVG